MSNWNQRRSEPLFSYRWACSVSADRKVTAWRQKRTLAKVFGGQASHEPRRWEEDYQLVEYQGLFEEYLEMGKYLHSLNAARITGLSVWCRPKRSDLCCSAPVWLHHHLRGSVPPRAPLRSPKQLGGNPPGRSQVCVWVPPPGGRARPEHRRVVQHPGGAVPPVSHRQRESPPLSPTDTSF